LKEKAGKESARHMSDLDSINRELKSDQDMLDIEMRKKLDVESKMKNKGHDFEESPKFLARCFRVIKLEPVKLSWMNRRSYTMLARVRGVGLVHRGRFLCLDITMLSAFSFL
jgi:hypothetical protein